MMTPEIQRLLIVAGLAAPVAWCVVETVKNAVVGFWPEARQGRDAQSWQWSLRVVSLVAGALVGAYIGGGFAQADVVLAGAGGGALSAVIVATLRREMRAMAARVTSNALESQGLPAPTPEELEAHRLKKLGPARMRGSKADDRPEG